jgi:hypothetical protein
MDGRAAYADFSWTWALWQGRETRRLFSEFLCRDGEVKCVGKRDSQALLQVFMQGWRGKVCRERTSVEVDQRMGGQDVTVLISH